MCHMKLCSVAQRHADGRNHISHTCNIRLLRSRMFAAKREPFRSTPLTIAESPNPRWAGTGIRPEPHRLGIVDVNHSERTAPS